MFCPKCGNELIDGAAYCSVCGTKLDFIPTGNSQGESRGNAVKAEEKTWFEEEPSEELFQEGSDAEKDADLYETDINDYYQKEPAPKKDRKPLIIALCAAAAAVIVIVALFASGMIGGGSKGGMLSAPQKTAKAIVERSEVTKFFYDLKNSDQSGATIKAENLGNMLSVINPYLSILNINAQLDIAGDKKGSMSATLDVDAFGSKVRAGIYKAGGDGDIVIDVPSILKDPYGISLKTAVDDLDKSILSPNSGSDYSVSEDTFEQIRSIVSRFASAGSTAGGLDTSELVRELQSNDKTRLSFEKSKGEADVGDGSVKCEIYTAKVDEKLLGNIVEYTGQWLDQKIGLKDNPAITALMNSVGSYYDSFDEFLNETVSDIMDTDVTLEISQYICKGYLVRNDIRGAISSTDIDLSICFGSDPSKSEEITMTIKADDRELTASVDLSRAADNYFRISMRSSDNEDMNARLTFDYDKDRSTFELKVSTDTEMTLSGGMTIDGNTLTITDPYIDAGYSQLSIKGLTVSVTKSPVIRKMKDDFPSGYSNFFRMSEEEFEKIADQLSGLGSTIGSLLY